MNPAINHIAANKTSGAAEILRLAGEVFSQLERYHPDLADGNVREARQAILETAVALVRAQPDMSPLLRLASVAISAASSSKSAHDALMSVEAQALKFIDAAQIGARSAASNAASIILPDATVMTHSRSSTVLDALISARRNGKAFSVVATESHPGMEGRTLAQTLVREDIRVSLIADVDASVAMDGVDIVIVGADTITHDVLVNKIGTRMLALWAQQRELPFYAVCDESKFINASYLRGLAGDEESGDSLWPDAPTGVLSARGYFEAIPLAYFTGIITENGVLSGSEASRCAAQASIDERLSDALGELRLRIR